MQIPTHITNSRRTIVALAILALSAASYIPAAAQSAMAAPRDTLTDADYARAEKFMSWSTAPLVSGASVRVDWLPGDRLWYRNSIPGGTEFVLVDAARKTRKRAFDQKRVAAALSTAADTTFDPFELPISELDFSADGKSVSFQAGTHHWRCDVGGERCEAAENAGVAPPRNSVTSPDGKLAVYIRDENLWVRDLSSGKDRQLTTDGVKDFGYATDNAGWTRSDRPIVLWSPDSRKIATFQQDQRGVGEMYLVDTRVGHPKLEAWKYPLPGDSIVSTIQRVIIDVDAPRVVRLDMPPDQHRSTLCDHVTCRGTGFADVQWSPDGSQLAFVSSSRDHKSATLRLADAATGRVRDVLNETVPTFFESGNGAIDWRVLFGSNEVIWFSERNNWGNLYLYDLGTGQLKHSITSGEGNVLQLLRVDQKARTVYFTGAGREPGTDPYFRHLYRAGLDGGKAALLTPENADHDVALSPSGRYFVDSYSRPDVAPITVLRESDGKVRLPLEKADISRLVATGWTPPIPFTVKARDDSTDIYGLLYRPTGFDSTKKYPIINKIYPGPQTGSVGSRSFSAARGDSRALAELGFIVVEIDAMGTPGRSKSFHAAYYGDMGDNGLPDQIAGMKQLASRYSWIDIDRAGIYGHSGGGFAAADAILRYPDFFKVAVSEAGNHENRNYEDDWGEKWQGLLETRPDGSTNYDNQANQKLAGNLRGKLLIAFGTMDSNVPPSNSLLLVDELIRHNKDFDLIALPNRNHGFGNESYMVRRRWDYFVRNLMGAVPPREYEFHRARNTVSGLR